ncbi:MAG: threonine aldolase, partial [Planctomycetota bacterium]|nr:threonine aldolase [Planctomycetota bacterium]
AGAAARGPGAPTPGLARGEAALYYSQGDGSARARAARAFPFMRKRAGALLSKHRFVSAPFAATLADGSWLKHAAHANEMAGRLSAGLKGAGVEVPYSTDANAVFATLPEELDARLRERGHEYYMFGHPAWRLGRLMCSWDSAPEEVGEFLKDVEGAARRHEGT